MVVKWEKFKIPVIIILAVGLFSVAYVASVYPIIKKSEDESAKEAAGEITTTIATVAPSEHYDDSSITLSEFNSLRTGMTYLEVVDIIGGYGTLLSETDLGIGLEYITKIYQWDGEGSLGANANVTFQGGKLISKAQYGLN